MGKTLARYEGPALSVEKARDMLAACRDLSEVKAIRDKAVAVVAYLRSVKAGKEAIASASAVVVLGEYRAGQFLKDAKLPGRDVRPVGAGRGIKDDPCGILNPGLSDYGISPKQSMRFQRLAAEFSDDEMDAIVEQAKEQAAPLSTNRMLREAESRRRVRTKAAAKVSVALDPKRVDVRCCSMQDLLGSETDLDAIVTDPPYPEEFLPLYPELARLAAKALKPGGVLAVMCGQSYLPRILHEMSEHIPYRWTLAYLTPGGQAVQLWQRHVNTFWKPILLFGGVGPWLGDVVRSDVNDNDKRFHGWGQSVSGMVRLVEAVTEPGARVCDPFLGAGTTGVACVATHRRFVGCDIDQEHVDTARVRLSEACTKADSEDE